MPVSELEKKTREENQKEQNNEQCGGGCVVQ
jgi:hypothetical protein